MTDADIVLTRDRSSGRVHVRVRDGDRLLVDERCNLDAAGTFEVIDSIVDVDPDMLCGHCFPAGSERASA